RRRYWSDELCGGGLGEQDEAELAGLAEQEPEPEASSPRGMEGAAEQRDEHRLGRDHRRGEADHEQRPRRDQAEIEHHPDRQEEQTEEDRPERLDVAFELVAVGGFGKHYAGDKRAQRNRQV